MKTLLTTTIGRLRLCAFLEGVSLLILVFVAVPLKYGFGLPSLVSSMGPIHGALFLLFVFSALRVGVEQRWKFRETTWKVLLACIIPFGTLYLDYILLRKLQSRAT
ncbi:DUF3817 domain-containing protein [Parapedobacter deserti]|uniref:DUF3817 domain-containing protein n=1 Tax=Parapedobacter deserti TaxID=1912957 RepID=A0ABV7JNI4_9SPHI